MKKSLFVLLLVHLTINGTSVKAQSSPSTIPNLQLWLDASDPANNGTTPTGALNTWKDKSGGGRDGAVLSGQNPGIVVANQINGKAVVRFTKSTQLVGCVYNVPAVDIRATTMPQVTIFTVYKQGTQGGDQGLWGNDNGDWDRFYFTTTTATPNNGAVSLGPQTNPTAVISNAGLVGVTRLMTAVYDRNTTNGSAVYFNGGLVQTFNDQTHLTNAQTSLRIGFDGDDNTFNGDIAEMLVYNRKLTNCEIQLVNRYLGAKYGITFSTASITPGSATFNEGGRATLTASTGTAYQWLRNGTAISGATGNTYTAYLPGNYQVAVTNGCVDTSGITTVTTTQMVQPGNALNLDGVNDYVDLGNGGTADPNSLLANKIKSMECWVKFNSFSGDQELLSKSVTSSGIELLVYGTQLAFFCMDGTNNCHVDYPVSNLTTGTWYHIAGTWDGVNKNSMRLYVNGQSVGTYYPTGNNVSGVTDPGVANTFKIGRWSTTPVTRQLNGSIDEVRIWSVQRTPTEIANNAYAPLTLPATGLIAYYKFDQGTAAGTNPGSDYAYDYSGNGVTGTLSGFALNGATSNWVESYAMVKPVISAPNTVRPTSFLAGWIAPTTGTVDNYILDVATDAGFTSFVSGYPKNVGNVTSYLVTGLTLGNTYYYRVRTNKTTADGIAAPSGINMVTTQYPLPVKLQSFTAAANRDQVLLEWTSAAEQNSDHFDAERSNDAVTFRTIASVTASGDFLLPQKYTAIDALPENGNNYYRLKMMDKDGAYSYSAIRQVIFNSNGQAVYSVYPSPAAAYVTIESGQQTPAGTTGVITDMYGRALVHFTLNDRVSNIALGTLPAGNYFVRLADGSVFKITKQ